MDQNSEVEVKMIAEYKGRKYRLVWQGKTKFGERAKLQFFDGSKEFWVNSSLIKVHNGDRYRSDDYRITKTGKHLVKVEGRYGSYWREADDRDYFDEFDC